MSTDYSYIGVGKAYIRERGAAAGLVEMGNASALNCSPQEEVKRLLDFTAPGGGSRNRATRITEVQVGITLTDLSPANLARGLLGDASSVAAGSAVDEPATAYVDSLVRTMFVGPTSVVVTDGTGVTTYTAGSDYEVRPAGIYILPGSTIADGTSILIDYDYGAGDVIEAITNSGKEWEMVFEGLNEARSDKPVVVDIYRLKFSPAQSVDFIGDDYASLQLTGEALKDTSKTGAGISQYIKVRMAA